MTDIDLLKESVNTLGNIPIPAKLIESIGIPIYNVRSNLITLINAVTEKQAEEEKPAEE